MMISINISDLHFGAFDPKRQYNILKEQCFEKVAKLNRFDFFCIQGDIFERKYLANNDAVMYASLFIQDVANLCLQKDAMLIIISGTSRHDSDQIKLFYHLMISNPNVRILETIGFVEHHGYKVLCIPELYGIPVDVYNKYLFESGIYHMAIFHGFTKGAVYGCDEARLDSDKFPIFDLKYFYNCMGPILGGHVHTSTCIQQHIYYTGCPYRWEFGQEEAKGFMVTLLDTNSYKYYVHFNPINSDNYNTYNLDHMLNEPVEDIANFIKQLQIDSNDHVKIRFNQESPKIAILKDYFRYTTKIIIDANDVQFARDTTEVQDMSNKFYEDYAYLGRNSSLNDYEKLVMYINQQEGSQFITVPQFMDVINSL